MIEEHGRYVGLQQTEGDYEIIDEDLSPPQIHGHSSKYNIGDIIDLNCSSLPASPAPYLEWFINGRLVRKAVDGLLFNPFPLFFYTRVLHRS